MKLGFGRSPQGRKVYLNHQYPECLWYFWDHSNKTYVPILHESLTGYLKSIYLSEKEYKKDQNQKLNFVFDCEDDRYIVEVGIDTIPARKLVEGFSVVDISKAVTIAPKAGDKEPNAIFVNFYQEHDRIRVESTEGGDFLGLLANLMMHVNVTKPDVDSIEPSAIPQTSPSRSTAPTPKLPTLPTAAKTDNLDQPISDADRAKFVAIVREQKWTTAAVTAYLGSCGYTNSRLILNRDFISISNGIREADICDHFHGLTDVEAVSTLPLGTWESAA